MTTHSEREAEHEQELAGLGIEVAQEGGEGTQGRVGTQDGEGTRAGSGCRLRQHLPTCESTGFDLIGCIANPGFRSVVTGLAGA